jgi:hypothetical protein
MRATRGVEAAGLGHVDQQRYAERYMGSAVPTGQGTPLEDASAALLAAFDATGVLPESTVDSRVLTWQQAWNADPSNTGDQLVADGRYGPLTYGAFNVMVGGMAPAVNGGSSPTVVVPGTVTPGSSTTTSEAIPWLLIAAAAGAAYFLFFRKRKTVHHHRAPGTAVEIKTNPRRRRRNAGRRSGELLAL